MLWPTDGRIEQQSGTDEVRGRSTYLSSDASGNSYQNKSKPGRRRRRHRFVSSMLSEASDDGSWQPLERPALRPTISQRSHLMPIISSHHTIVFIIVTLLHSLFTSGTWYSILFRVIIHALARERRGGVSTAKSIMPKFNDNQFIN